VSLRGRQVRYFKYLAYGLALMAPQELIVALFKTKPPALYFMALAFWAALLTVMYAVLRRLTRSTGREGVSVTLYALLAMLLGFTIEWGLIGNSPWRNPGANQAGLVAGWVSVFILPLAFLDERAASIRTLARAWYAPFVMSIFLPVLILGEKGRVVGIILYGYSVIPFLLLSVWYCWMSWQSER
jgi:hypothetical protein